MLKLNNQPIGENSPHLVTLLSSLSDILHNPKDWQGPLVFGQISGGSVATDASVLKRAVRF
jgi:hypothetical protein